jgi:xylan 1,4-beta-xylosidase
MSFSSSRLANSLYYSLAPALVWLVLLLWLPQVATAQRAKKQPLSAADTEKTWLADNGNGTFSNPLFYEEFSDPDLIRVGSDYYLTGTTMHAMPGLPVLHSKDLVNWELLSYAVDKLDFGPAYRLEEGKDIYGRGIWAPSFRYANGKFHIFTNVNGRKTQLFTATNPAGPWTHTELKKSFHDLSLLFDDDGKTYVIWGYDELRIAELTADLTDTKPGTEQVLIPRGSGVGEGSHFYKINGKYFITNTNYDPIGYMVCARADKPTGPYEVTVISAQETLGIGLTARLHPGQGPTPPFQLDPPQTDFPSAIPLHQGGIVETPTGEWWGFSMMDHNAIGRLLCLSPVTWTSGWPYFGLPGNLKRSPQTWVKPNTGATSAPMAPFRRGDEFGGPKLNPLWQWNHVPVEGKWSLNERKGFLRLHALPAKSFWSARNSLTQRAIGPESTPTTELDTKGLKPGDMAGLALLNHPYSWIGVARTAEGLEVQQYDEQTDQLQRQPLKAARVWLRAQCNFDTDQATFQFSTDGQTFQPLGGVVTMVFQLRTFQGVRYTLFSYNTLGKEGGYADFDRFTVAQPRSRGLTKPIPVGQTITLLNLADSTVLINWRGLLRPVPLASPLAKGKAAHFRVVDRGLGRIALESAGGLESEGGVVTVGGLAGIAEVRLVKGPASDANTFQWQDMLRGDLMLMSLTTHRYLTSVPRSGGLCSADAPGTRPDRKDGSCFTWQVVPE